MSDTKPGILEETKFRQGPFAIIVDDPTKRDDAYPFVVAPEGGFADKATARAYIEENFANREEKYLGLQFMITVLRTPGAFNQYCSLED